MCTQLQYPIADALVHEFKQTPHSRDAYHLQITVSQDGIDQIIDINTTLEAGRLLLHWGVEGGKDYKGGWRLPDGACRPEGTQQYKDRALQTPFRCDCKP